ncbi:MAG: serine/threonine protein kinase [Alphaproteobacteria bacterium]|nr:serine/threonine protein kinase [Alphaproteobacteria bacterium]
MRDPLLGSTVAGYQLRKALGAGNMAQLYRGVDESGRVAALKVLKPSLRHERELLARFEREFESTAAIHHPNVVEALDHGTVDGLPYLVLEFLEGRTLADVRDDEAPLDPVRTARIGADIAWGLGAAHAGGVVHRDLKPENVMVCTDGRVKVFDFGLSAPRDVHAPRLTNTDLRLGTPMYMAPEYIQRGDVDHRSDLYALGVVLFELVTDGQPFKGPPYKVMHAKITGAAPRARTLRPDVPEPLDALVASLLLADANARPQSATDVAEALEALAT